MLELRALQPDAAALEELDLGPDEPWLHEVREIVAGLPGWVTDPAATELDRQALVHTNACSTDTSE